jgi:hypothetical protein
MRRTLYDPELDRMASIAYDLRAEMALTFLPATIAANMLDQVITTGLFMSVHSATPGNTGASELAAGTAYTAVSGGRPPIDWGSIASGVVDSNDVQIFALLVTQAGGIPYWGLWTANVGGSWVFGGPTTGLTGSIPSGANVVFTDSVVLTQAG